MSGALARMWGQNIRLFRKAKDLRDGTPEREGLRAMAEYLNVSPATVSRWETGRITPRDEMKVEIAEYLEVDARSLFPLVRVPG